MITTRREVNIDNGIATAVRITPEENITYVNPDNEVRSYATAVETQTDTTVRITPHADMVDLMPQVKHDEVAEMEEEVETVPALSRKTKMALCVYLASAFIIALVVLFTGFAITNTSSEVAALQNQLLAQTETLTTLQSEIAQASTTEEIVKSATAQGMVQSAGATEIEILNLSDAPTYEERTNFFDQLCDFFSKIIGG